MLKQRPQTAISGGVKSQHRGEILFRYGQMLERYSSPVGKETDLPYPKELIRKAICDELREDPDSELRSFLEIAFIQLECFLPPDEFKAVQDFKRAGVAAQEMAQSGNPGDIVASAAILSRVKGEKAVSILEKISRKIQKRTREIRAVGLPVFRTREC
jgi:hypothetical protein